jgi:hypothetical protein
VDLNDVAEIAKLSLLLEEKLSKRGVLDKNQLLLLAYPADLQNQIEGLIENVAELEGLLRIGLAARQGEALSPPVAGAARLMIEEVCEALFDQDEFRALRRLH